MADTAAGEFRRITCVELSRVDAVWNLSSGAPAIGCSKKNCTAIEASDHSVSECDEADKMAKIGVRCRVESPFRDAAAGS